MNDISPPLCPRAVSAAALAADLPALSDHALSWLRVLANDPVVRSAINPGVTDKLCNAGLVTEAQLPSPFKTHKGRRIPHMVITPAGRRYLANVQT